jgi:type IV secretory pathway VirB4 component
VLVAQTIQSTCIRLALQYPKSLIVGDEIADLLKKGGFAKTWGAMHAMARKSGISLLTISQNIEEIQKCSAAADILKNISFKLIGRITTDGATSAARRK